jgi:penicillin-binding protein 2
MRRARRIFTRRRRLPGRLELPGIGLGATGSRRAHGLPPAASALDVVDATEKAQAAREPGRARLGLRLSVTAAVVAASFGVLVVRLWSIQVINAQSARSSTIATTTRDVETPAPRGLIEARGGQILAGDVSELVVTLKTTIDAATNPATRVADPRAEANLAALVPGLTVKQIQAKLNNVQYGPYQPVPVTSVSPQVAATIEENPSSFPGAAVVPEYVRTYPQGSLAAQILGYLGPIPATEVSSYLAKGYLPTDSVGVSGLEEQYEPVLHGKPGIQQVEVDPQGNPVRVTKTTPPVPGDEVVLNMDLGLEKLVASSLASHIQSLRTSGMPAPWGAAVVLDASNGHVLAMASYPSYDNNEWVGGISEANYTALEKEYGYPLNDYVLQGTQAPGSTFKLATATAALDGGLISPSTVIDDPGYLQLPGGQILHDAPGEHPGPITLQTALSLSSDVFFYTLGERFYLDQARYGPTPIQDMAHRYGLGTTTGIDLPGAFTGWIDSYHNRQLLHEAAPAVYPPATWYLADNVEMAFGQGETEVTPIELAQAYATFANGGTRYAPELAGEIVSPTGKLVRQIAPKVMGHVSLPASTYDAMLAGFEGAVQSPIGTAYNDFIGFPFSKWLMAGKTGTATVAAHSAVEPTAWFVGFGGPINQPKRRFVAVVEVDQAGYGTSGAAPVVRQIFDYLYAHGGVLPPYHPVTATSG